MLKDLQGDLSHVAESPIVSLAAEDIAAAGATRSDQGAARRTKAHRRAPRRGRKELADADKSGMAYGLTTLCPLIADSRRPRSCAAMTAIACATCRSTRRARWRS